MSDHILITGGAGYIGSLLTGELLRRGNKVTVVDELLFGGDSIISYLPNPNFHFSKLDVCEPRALRTAIPKNWPKPKSVVHLSGIVGFPACQAVGKPVAWRYNVEATKSVYQQSDALGVRRLIFGSTYSNYGGAQDGTVTEESELHPQSLYAETKIAAEEYLLSQSADGCAPLIFRFATLYGISPRTRFDLIINQFVLEAYTKRELLIYQRGYRRSFVHVRDVVRGILLGLEAQDQQVRGQVFNLGSSKGNYSKDEVVARILKRLPETRVLYKDLTFGGDMRDISVAFEKIENELGFHAELDIDDGIREVLDALQLELIKNPLDPRYRNAQFIVQ